MRDWLNRIRYKSYQLMAGRYGMDELSRALLYLGIFIIILSFIPRLRLVGILTWVILIYIYYRALSKNIVKRRAEREKYLQMTRGIRKKAGIYQRIFKERKTHRYFRCNQCKSYVRVPRGKGKIIVRCTKCGSESTKNT